MIEIKKIKYSMIAVLAIASTLHAAEDLGIITVESSTIDDKFDAKKMEVSNTVTLTGEEINDQHSENIADVLNKVPGVTVRKNEGDSNKIHIRGVGTEMYMGEKPGVAIVIDGVPVQERAGAVNIDMDNIETLKIIKGGASYLYGNDALAGAIIITTKRPKAVNEGFVLAEGGSDGYEKYIANYMGSTENFAYEIQGSYKASDGWWDESDYWAKSFNGKVQYYIDDTSDITIGADISKRYENDTGSITHTVDGVNQVETNPKSYGEVGYSTDYDIDLDKYFLTYSKDFSNNSNLMAQVYRYEDKTTNKNGAYYNDQLPGSTLRNDHLYDAYAKTTQDGFKSEYRQDGEKLAYMIGLDIARNEEDKNSVYRVDYTDRGGNQFFIGDVNSDTHFDEDINAFYGELKYQINDRLITTFNVRYDDLDYHYTNNLTPASWDKDFDEMSYRAGATYKLEENSILYASFSTGFRVPTIDQLYAGDILSGRYDYQNNPNIDTETTKNYELGYRGQHGLLTYDVSIFQLERDDMITRNGGNYVGDIASPIMYGNFADARNRGLELSMNSDKSQEFSFELGYAYLDAEYRRYDEYNLVVFDETVPPRGSDVIVGTYDLAGNTIPRTSKHTVNVEGNYRVTPNWILTADYMYRSSQYADELNAIKLGGYSVTNFRTKYNTNLYGFDTEFYGKIENAFDKQYFMMPRATGDRNDDGAYNLGDLGLTVNPGRTVLMGLSVRF